MSSSPPLPFQCFRRAGGVDVVPSMLPIPVSYDAYGITVAEFFGLEREDLPDDTARPDWTNG
jgi:hypothetical protein